MKGVTFAEYTTLCFVRLLAGIIFHFGENMSFSSANCNGLLELSFFIIAIMMVPLIILSAFIVFEAGTEDEKEEHSWKYLPLLWLWPIRPFYSTDGLNNLGKKWRPIYKWSISILTIVSLIMYFGGYCSEKIQ